MRMALTAAPSAPFLVAAAHPPGGGQGGRLGDPDQLHGQVAVGCLRWWLLTGQTIVAAPAARTARRDRAPS